MTRPKPLPLAPRPFPDESVRSWIGRVAARYDLEPMELIACLRGGADVARLASLDWLVDVELEILLARAARLDRAQIGKLRILMRDMPFPETWHRRLLAWCSACVGEDIGRYGETSALCGVLAAVSPARHIVGCSSKPVYAFTVGVGLGLSRDGCGWFASSAGDLPMDCKRACPAQMLGWFSEASCHLVSHLIFKRICFVR